MSWPDTRKLEELRSKLSSLEAEFAHWQAESEEGMPLRKHHTQIRRVSAALEALRTRIVGELDTLADRTDGSTDDAGEVQDVEDVQNVQDVETMILDVHRIWEFFRAKLSQRYVPWFRPFLVAADQFAWDCYSPVRDSLDPGHVAAAAVREPPMVFFNGGWSPFTMSRGVAYEAEFVPEEDFPRDRYRALLEDLPFPVIGVPWYQVRHLPDAVLLGHEVGHNVEDDLRLGPRLRALLASAMDAGQVPAARRDGWAAWLGETFADVFGTLAAGPAFGGALIDLVAGPPDQIATERAEPPDWGDYPPAALRVHVTLAALAEAGYSAAAEALGSRWRAMFPSHAMTSWEPDAGPLVSALLRTPIPELRGRQLIEVLSFAALAARAGESSSRMLAGYKPTVSDARILLAAARLAFEADAPKYRAKNVGKRVLDGIQVGQDRAVRAREPAATPARVALSAADVQLGDALFNNLAALRT